MKSSAFIIIVSKALKDAEKALLFYILTSAEKGVLSRVNMIHCKMWILYGLVILQWIEAAKGNISNEIRLLLILIYA